MKKYLVLIVALLMAMTMTAAIAASAEGELGSRMVSNETISVENGVFFVYLIREQDLELEAVTYEEEEITIWDGIFVVSTSKQVVGRFYPDYNPGKKTNGMGQVKLSGILNGEGNIYPENVFEGVSNKEAIDFVTIGDSDVKPRYVYVLMPDGTYRMHMVVDTEARPTPTPPGKKPTPTPRPALNDPTDPNNGATARPTNTPAPALNDPTKPGNQATPQPALNPPNATTKPGTTPRPQVVDPNPTLSPEDEAKLDFEDIPANNNTPKPTSRPTPRPQVSDPNPTLSPSQEGKLDFGTTPKPTATPTPKPRPNPNPGLSNPDTNPEIPNSGLDF